MEGEDKVKSSGAVGQKRYCPERNMARIATRFSWRHMGDRIPCSHEQFRLYTRRRCDRWSVGVAGRPVLAGRLVLVGRLEGS